MNNNITKKAILGVVITGLLSACGGSSKNFDDPVQDETYSSGDVDLSRYVALGDSLTAGYKDGTLYLDGQLDSFPNILAGLFAEADGGTFTQPLMADNLGGLLFGSIPNPDFDTRLVLDNVNGSLGPVRQNGTPTTEVFNIQTTPVNNMGVPGAKSFHLGVDDYGSQMGLLESPPEANPFYVRFAPSPSTSILVASLTQAPSFFTLWIGNNDILAYATGGGVGNDSTTMPAYGLGSDDITDPVNVFAPTYNSIVANLSAGGAKGILMNLPSVVDIPFFTTVPFNPIPLTQEQADAANTAFAAYNRALQAAAGAAPFPVSITAEEAQQRTIVFTAGLNNPALILDESLNDLSVVDPALLNYRQATADDYILLPTSSVLGTLRVEGDLTSVIGVGFPLLDSEVLTAAEAMEIEMAREAYNSVIEGLAAGSPDLAMYDVAALLADLNDGDGVSYGTGSVDNTFATGGAFSLDGVHPTAKGYAIIANGIIDTMNAAFAADLPKTDPGDYTETFFAFPDDFDFSP